jgi:FolB domain-containing protein
MERILITDLKAFAVIGVRGRERKHRQRIVINLSLECDLEEAARADDLSKTVDYSWLAERVLVEVKGSRFYLLEALADSIAGICLEHPLVKRVEVSVAKPGALSRAKAACIEMVRERNDS